MKGVGTIRYKTTKPYKDIKYYNHNEETGLFDIRIFFDDGSIYIFENVREIYFPIEGTLVIECEKYYTTLYEVLNDIQK